jgi:hypothetical protein
MGKCVSKTHLLGLRPLVLGQKLVRDGALEGAADAVDAIVGLLGRETLEGLDDVLVLLGDQVVGAVLAWQRSASEQRDHGRGRGAANGGPMARGGGGGRAAKSNAPETQLTVASGVGVPAGERLHEAAQPGPLHDEGREGRVGGHGGRFGGC